MTTLAAPRIPAKEAAAREPAPEAVEGDDPAPEEVMLGAREEPDRDPD